MSNKLKTPRTSPCELPRDVRAEAILEFVFNDEEEALTNEAFVLSHQADMPALQEFLEHMHDLDAHLGGSRCH